MPDETDPRSRPAWKLVLSLWPVYFLVVFVVVMIVFGSLSADAAGGCGGG